MNTLSLFVGVRGRHRLLWLLAAIGIVVAAPASAPAQEPVNSGQPGDGCQKLTGETAFDSLQKEASKSLLIKASGRVGDLGINPLIEYLTNPDDTKLDAAVNSLIEGGLSIAIPGYGPVVEGGKIVIGGTTYMAKEVIEEARNAKMQTLADGFFNTPAIRDKGITEDNIGEKITTEEEFKKNWNYYTVAEREISSKEKQRMLSEAGERGLKIWRIKRAAALRERVRAELKEAARRAAEARKKACAPQPGICPDLTASKWRADYHLEGELPSTFERGQPGQEVTFKTAVDQAQGGIGGYPRGQVVIYKGTYQGTHQELAGPGKPPSGEKELSAFIGHLYSLNVNSDCTKITGTYRRFIRPGVAIPQPVTFIRVKE